MGQATNGDDEETNLPPIAMFPEPRLRRVFLDSRIVYEYRVSVRDYTLAGDAVGYWRSIFLKYEATWVYIFHRTMYPVFHVFVRNTNSL